MSDPRLTPAQRFALEQAAADPRGRLPHEAACHADKVELRLANYLAPLDENYNHCITPSGRAALAEGGK